MSKWPYTGPLSGWGSVRIVSSELCMATDVHFEVRKTNPRARRKRYRSVRVETRRPTAYWCGEDGGYFIAHPKLIERMKEST